MSEWVGGDFVLHPRDLLVDVGIIENTAARPIMLSDFRGARDATEGLRALVARRFQSESGSAARLDIGDVTLSPGARVALPLRLLFASPESVRVEFDRIPSRDRPRQMHYIYGPELGIASFALDGERIELTRPSANHLALRITYGENVVSIPVCLRFRNGAVESPREKLLNRRIAKLGRIPTLSCFRIGAKVPYRGA